MHPINLHAKAFRAWVDEAALEFNRLSTDLASLYQNFSLDGTHGLSRAKLADYLRDKAYQTLVARDGINPDRLGALGDHLYLQHLVEGAALQPYLDTLETLQLPIPYRNHRNGQQIVFIEDAECWRQAAFYAYTAHQLNPVAGMPDDAREAASRRQHQAAEAAKSLKARGYQPVVDGGRVRFYGQHERIADEIGTLIRRVGGYELLIALCRAHQPLLDPTAGRYRVGRQVGGIGAAIPAQLPWAYLQNLAAKHHHMPRSDEAESRDTVREIAEFATALVATLDVQPYHQLDGVLLSVENIEEEMDEALRYDAAFLPTQVNPRVAISMIKALFRWVDDPRLESDRGWTMASASVLCEVLLSGDLGVPLVFTRSALLANLPTIPPSHIDKLLYILSHEPGAVNVDYRLPGDSENLSDKPLLRTSDGTYRLFDPSLCALAFVEALANDLRVFDPKRGQKRIGLYAEELVREQLSRRGLIVHSGTYKDCQGKDGECDVVVETAHTVIFIELKAKALTRIAKGGDRVKLFDDLAKSLLHAQVQAGLHELRLRRDGFLDLASSDGATYRLELRDRDIQKFALTLFEFGALQDQLFVRSFLDVAIHAAVVSDDDKAHDFCTRHGELVELYKELMTEHPELKRLGFTNVWFLSVSMVLSMIENVRSGPDLETVLKKIGRVSFRTRNFFNELALAQTP